MNLKKLKYPLEDILIYNIKSNTMKIGVFKNDKLIYSSKNFYVPQRRNHIAQIIGWNMIVHGGVDINKEYLKESNSEVNEEEIRTGAMLAAYYSTYQDSSSVQVDYTRIRNIKKIPGKRACFVSYTHQQTIYIDPDSDFIYKLKVKK